MHLTAYTLMWALLHFAIGPPICISIKLMDEFVFIILIYWNYATSAVIVLVDLEKICSCIMLKYLRVPLLIIC